MRLTTFTDYSLRVLIYLALEPGRRATIAEIAAAFGISRNHLMKVVHFLGRNRLLRNVRGRGGGMTLARPPAEINVGEVVRLAEAGSLPAECFDRDTNTCLITPACQLRRALGEAVEGFYQVLGRYTLADLVSQPRALTRLLALPHRPSDAAARIGVSRS
ncbi:MAG: Rrf2 family transcriptional regulator [Gammaproteobacteria bacterium]|nr:Rrf2 family transcriptional regulator [Gammaproteobacteria bacterium]